ncbi:N-acetyltransferase [Vibrio zhanjiangensis]|uniref:N-acetyltransferase n=1 Tax=Vibrio zhanjiangensis TaxID=1046128 RepID=A0ABQ6EVV2_9VIBR|nr:N-acetyltransferase [Vibrio zhanjiangensis]
MIIATRRTLLMPYNESLQSEFLMLNYCTKNRMLMDGSYTVSSAKRLFQRILHDPSIYSLAVLDNQSRDYIGHVFIYNLDERPTLGFLFDKAYWGRGIASEVLSAFLPQALHHLHLYQVIASVDSHHIASIRVLEKIGFEQQSDLSSQKSAHRHYVFTSCEGELALE